MDNNIVYEWILKTTFTVSARQKSLQRAKPYFSTLVQPGDEILDLCCGSGFLTFWFGKQGAKVTGIDFAPYDRACKGRSAPPKLSGGIH